METRLLTPTLVRWPRPVCALVTQDGEAETRRA